MRIRRWFLYRWHFHRFSFDRLHFLRMRIHRWFLHRRCLHWFSFDRLHFLQVRIRKWFYRWHLHWIGFGRLHFLRAPIRQRFLHRRLCGLRLRNLRGRLLVRLCDRYCLQFPRHEYVLPMRLRDEKQPAKKRGWNRSQHGAPFLDVPALPGKRSVLIIAGTYCGCAEMTRNPRFSPESPGAANTSATRCGAEGN